MRKLASVQKIISVSEIKDPKTGEPANSIEAVKVLGWECVAKKGEFKAGDLAIYFEIDSIIPDEILKAANLWKEEENKGMLSKAGGNVLTTKRMLGVVSQGLVLPTSLFKRNPPGAVEFVEDMDMTESLGIGKYERFVEDETENTPNVGRSSPFKRKLIKALRPSLFWISHNVPFADHGFSLLAEKYHFFRQFLGSGGPFPSFIPKTDQTRIQNLTRNFEELVDDHFEETEKMEGTSSTYFYYKGDYGMCSRNLRKSNFSTDHFGFIQKKHEIFKKLRKYKKNIALQGEICGPGIQGNYYGLSDYTWFIFDVYLIDEGRKALHGERCNILSDLGLNTSQAPLVGLHSFKGFTTQQILERAICKSVVNTKVDAEGRVYKSLTRPNVHFKAINNNYLLKQK